MDCPYHALVHFTPSLKTFLRFYLSFPLTADSADNVVHICGTGCRPVLRLLGRYDCLLEHLSVHGVPIDGFKLTTAVDRSPRVNGQAFSSASHSRTEVVVQNVDQASSRRGVESSRSEGLLQTGRAVDPHHRDEHSSAAHGIGRSPMQNASGSNRDQSAGDANARDSTCGQTGQRLGGGSDEHRNRDRGHLASATAGAAALAKQPNPLMGTAADGEAWGMPQSAAPAVPSSRGARERAGARNPPGVDSQQTWSLSAWRARQVPRGSDGPAGPWAVGQWPVEVKQEDGACAEAVDAGKLLTDGLARVPTDGIRPGDVTTVGGLVMGHSEKRTFSRQRGRELKGLLVQVEDAEGNGAKLLLYGELHER